MNCPILAVTNHKGGVGKTTTSVNLAQALALRDLDVLLVDLDPTGNATQGVGVKPETVQGSIVDVLRSREFPIDSAIYRGDRLDLIPSTSTLTNAAVELRGMPNSELRLARRLAEVRDRYSIIVIDCEPTRGILLTSLLNAATHVIVPIDSSFYGLMGLKDLSGLIEEIRFGFNSGLQVLGYLLTMADPTNLAGQTHDTLLENFGDRVFETRIRRSVKLREAPAFGRTIFHHAPDSNGARDYMNFADEVLQRLGIGQALPEVSGPALAVLNGGKSVAHE